MSSYSFFYLKSQIYTHTSISNPPKTCLCNFLNNIKNYCAHGHTPPFSFSPARAKRLAQASSSSKFSIVVTFVDQLDFFHLPPSFGAWAQLLKPAQLATGPTSFFSPHLVVSLRNKLILNPSS